MEMGLRIGLEHALEASFQGGKVVVAIIALPRPAPLRCNSDGAHIKGVKVDPGPGIGSGRGFLLVALRARSAFPQVGAEGGPIVHEQGRGTIVFAYLCFFHTGFLSPS